MIRIAFLAAIVLLLLFAVAGGYRWLARNRVRVSLSRPPTGREVFFLAMLARAMKALLWFLLRRF